MTRRVHPRASVMLSRVAAAMGAGLGIAPRTQGLVVPERPAVVALVASSATAAMPTAKVEVQVPPGKGSTAQRVRVAPAGSAEKTAVAVAAQWALRGAVELARPPLLPGPQMCMPRVERAVETRALGPIALERQIPGTAVRTGAAPLEAGLSRTVAVRVW